MKLPPSGKTLDWTDEKNGQLNTFNAEVMESKYAIIPTVLNWIPTITVGQQVHCDPTVSDI